MFWFYQHPHNKRFHHFIRNLCGFNHNVLFIRSLDCIVIHTACFPPNYINIPAASQFKCIVSVLGREEGYIRSNIPLCLKEFLRAKPKVTPEAQLLHIIKKKMLAILLSLLLLLLFLFFLINSVPCFFKRNSKQFLNFENWFWKHISRATTFSKSNFHVCPSKFSKYWYLSKVTSKNHQNGNLLGL